MKKIILAVCVGLISIAAVVPQFFYYNDLRKAIAIRNDTNGIVVIKDRTNQTVMVVNYPANSSRWISVSRLAPGQYTASTVDGTILFYKRP